MKYVKVDLSLYTMATLSKVFDVHRNTILKYQKEGRIPYTHKRVQELVDFLRWGK